ncbi:Cyclic nucleotide-binding domain-containing protein [Burkholderiales bacterium 8X]|nr:Cyclic nucleotide-binding domain-containing protein [Burkholderiales bacterium 8X]
MTYPHAIDEAVDLRELAVQMLTELAPPARLSRHEARIVVHAMRPVQLQADTLLFKEGDTVDNDYMVLVLEGQLRVVSEASHAGEEVVISVVGAGQILGEMGVIDGGPRSATCVALSEVKLAVLSRVALSQLIEVHPAAAARLALSLSRSLADRVRESNRRLRLLTQLARAAQAELDAVHAVNRRLLNSMPA